MSRILSQLLFFSTNNAHKACPIQPQLLLLCHLNASLAQLVEQLTCNQ